MRVKFTIKGNPVPKGRPRVVMKGRYPVTYTPEKTRIWEEYVQVSSLPYKPIEFMEGPLRMKLRFIFVKPKSAKREYPNIKPDIDNLAKSIMDALEGVFYKNDSQVVDEVLSKRYGNVAMVKVEIEELE